MPDCLGAKIADCIAEFCFRKTIPAFKYCFRIYISVGSSNNLACRIKHPDLCTQYIDRFLFNKIHFCNNNLVRSYYLLNRFRIRSQMQLAINRIQAADYEIHKEMVCQKRIHKYRKKNWCRICKSCCFYNNTIHLYFFVFISCKQIFQLFYQILSLIAAYTSSTQKPGPFFYTSDEPVVKSGLPIFVDNNHSIPEFLIVQYIC